MCKCKATFWINMVLFQSLICFKLNFFTFNLFGFWDHSCSALTYGCCLQSLAPWHVLASLFTASSSLRTSLAHHHTLGLNYIIPPKIRLKNPWNILIILMSAAVWQILNMKWMKWPETEIIWTCWNLLGKIREITSGEHIFGRFGPFVTTVRQQHSSSQLAVSRRGGEAHLRLLGGSRKRPFEAAALQACHGEKAAGTLTSVT